jgi:hypothetical protein
MSTAPSTATWIALAEADDGFLGIEAVRNADGSEITVIYWKGLDSVAAFARIQGISSPKEGARNPVVARHDQDLQS